MNGQEKEAVTNLVERPKRSEEEHKQLLKFFIGIRLLGKEREKRFLEYMLTLQEKSDGSRDTSKERRQGNGN